jgi:hypothetical protein
MKTLIASIALILSAQAAQAYTAGTEFYRHMVQHAMVEAKSDPSGETAFYLKHFGVTRKIIQAGDANAALLVMNKNIHDYRCDSDMNQATWKLLGDIDSCEVKSRLQFVAQEISK